MLILIWQSDRQDLCIALQRGRYGVFYQGEQVAPFGSFEYAKRLAESEYVLNNERVFYADPASGFD